MSKIPADDDITVPVHGLPSAATRWNVQCLNCGSGLHGAFCSNCGQRAVPPRPSVRDLAGDAIAEFSGWDGKFAETIRTLITRPGEVTRQWLEGRRVHFISPLRVYLTASLVFFVVQGAAPRLGEPVIKVTASPRSEVAGKPSSPEVAANAASRAITSGKPLSQVEQDSAAAAISKAPGILRPILTNLTTNPAGVVANMRRYVSRVFFILLPFYAGILAVFYRRRHYPEHLYFAIHLHAFVFIALTCAELMKFTQVRLLAGLTSAATILWIIGYSILALRRVYGGSLGGTILKGIGIMMLYFMVALPALLLMITLAALY